MNYLVYAAIAVIPVISGIADAVLGSPPTPDAPVLVVIAPWTSAEAVLTGSGGMILDGGEALVGFIAVGPGEAFISHLSDMGALAVLDGAALAALCGV